MLPTYQSDIRLSTVTVPKMIRTIRFLEDILVFLSVIFPLFRISTYVLLVALALEYQVFFQATPKGFCFQDYQDQGLMLWLPNRMPLYLVQAYRGTTQDVL